MYLILHLSIFIKYGSAFLKFDKKCVYRIFFFPVFFFSTSSLLAQYSNDSAQNSSWSFSGCTYYYVKTFSSNNINLVGTADHKSLHLEGRYNYEDVNTISLFAGKKFSTGNKLQVEAIPMIGFSKGNTTGFTPAFEGTLAYKNWDAYFESEYMIDYKKRENNFFYNWLEIGVTSCNSVRTGFAIQHTQLYNIKPRIEPGAFMEYSFWKLTLDAYYLNPLTKNNYLLTAVTIEW